MRKDAGVDGDAQRLSQLVWMLFLKIFDDQESQLELFNPKTFRTPIPENLRWRNWAANAEGMTGDALLDFINDDLIKGLKALSADPEREPRGFLVKQVFEGAFNYMKDGTLIRQVINKLNEVNFNNKEDKHHFNEVYEHMLRELQSAGNAGEFYTPRPLTRFVVEMVAPEAGETILDPACGTGGFLVDAPTYIRENGGAKTGAAERALQAKVRGVELKSLPYLLATTNLMLHGVEVPTNIKHDDMLSRPLRDISASEKVNVIFANPPFGGAVKDGVEKNFPTEYRTKEAALLFLVLFIHLLKPGGRAGIVLPDGVLFGEGAASRIKEKLLTECNVHTIVRLPQGAFNPYAGVNTNLVFFTKGTPTKEIWYYQMPLPTGLRQYTKGRPITHAEFEPIKKWWQKRNANEYAWKVSIESVKERGWNLDFKNPSNAAAEAHKTPKEILAELEETEEQISALLGRLRNSCEGH